MRIPVPLFMPFVAWQTARPALIGVNTRHEERSGESERSGKLEARQFSLAPVNCPHEPS